MDSKATTGRPSLRACLTSGSTSILLLLVPRKGRLVNAGAPQHARVDVDGAVLFLPRSVNHCGIPHLMEVIVRSLFKDVSAMALLI